MRGFYFCKKCNLLIEVLTYVRTRNQRKDKIIINTCPHCKGKIKEVENTKFMNKSHSLFISVYRTYKLYGGNRKILLNLKFLK